MAQQLFNITPITYIMMIPTRSQLLLPLAVEEPDNYKETLEPYHGWTTIV